MLGSRSRYARVPIDLDRQRTKACSGCAWMYTDWYLAMQCMLILTTPLGFSWMAPFVSSLISVCVRVMQADLKTALASTLGGGDAIPADDIVIDSITAGSVTVAWHVEVPAAIMVEVASLVTTMAEESSSITVTVAGEAVAASEIALPVVYAEPDVDCVGAFTTCDASCTKYFDITTPASGSGADCDYAFYADEACVAGTDACPAATVDLTDKTSSAEVAACSTVILGVAAAMLSLQF